MITRMRRARVARKAARALPNVDIRWAVIAPSDEQESGWDYHLIRAGWGYGAAERLRDQVGGYIIAISRKRKRK